MFYLFGLNAISIWMLFSFIWNFVFVHAFIQWLVGLSSLFTTFHQKRRWLEFQNLSSQGLMRSWHILESIDNVLFNRIDKVSQSFREDGISWHGPKEKHFNLLSIIIWTCSYASNFVIKLTVGTCANYMIIIFLKGNNNLSVWICMYMWWCLNSCMRFWSKNFYQSLLQWKHAHSYTRRWHKLFQYVLKPLIDDHPEDVWFMINFSLCFMIGKTHGWGTFPKCEAASS
jgi:hypothetical protein